MDFYPLLECFLKPILLKINVLREHFKQYTLNMIFGMPDVLKEV